MRLSNCQSVAPLRATRRHLHPARRFRYPGDATLELLTRSYWCRYNRAEFYPDARAKLLDNSATPFSNEAMTGESFFGLNLDAGPEMLIAAIALPRASRIGAPMQMANNDPSPRS